MNQLFMKQIKIIVSGKVQGVGFRFYTQRKAIELGLTGYVQNLPNGNVEIIAVGEPTQIEVLREWAKSGSPNAIVDNLDIKSSNDDQEYNSFDIRREGSC